MRNKKFMLPPASRNRIYEKVSLLLLALPIVWGFYLVLRYGVNVCFGDEWKFVGMLDSVKNRTYTVKKLFAQHNEHRMVFPNLITIAVSLLTGLNSKALMLVDMGIVAISYTFCIRYIRSIFYDNRIKIVFFSLISGFLLFHAAQYENILWGFQTAWFLISLCSIISFVFLERLLRGEELDLSIFMILSSSFIASFSSLHGLFIWLAVDALVFISLLKKVFLKKRFYILLATAQVFCFVLYFHHYHKPKHHPAYLQNGILKAFEYYFSTIGQVCSPNHRIAFSVGFVIFLSSFILIFLAFYKKDFLKKNVLPLGLVIFGNLFALSVAVGRSGFGVEQAFSSRYTTNTVLIVLGILLCAMQFFSKNIMLTKIAFFDVLVALAVITAFENPVYLPIYESSKYSRLTDAYYLINHKNVDLRSRGWGELSIVTAIQLQILENNSWNVYSPSAKKTVAKYFEIKPISTFRIPRNEAFILCAFKNHDDYDSLQIAVWSEPDGQDDLQWFDVTVNRQKSFEYKIPLESYNTDGDYFIHVYGTKKEKREFITNARLEIDLFEIKKYVPCIIPDFVYSNENAPYYIDIESFNTGRLYLRGWAYHDNDECSVYIENDGSFYKATVESRQDVQAAFSLADSKHGFSIKLYTENKDYALYLVNETKQEVYTLK